MSRLKHFALTGLVALLLSACASQPRENAALEEARQAVASAAQNPVVVEEASRELERAREDLRRAEQLLQEGEDQEAVAHSAYLAQRQAQTAEAIARRVRAQAIADETSQQRQQVILESRERETQEARQEAQAARQQAEEIQQELQQAQQRLSEMEPKQTDRGLVLTLGSFLFNLDSAELKPEAMASLDRLAEYLKNTPGDQVLIEGYTDTTGPDEYNQRLSEQRAQAVVRALTRRGVSSDRLRAVGYGEDYPVATNESPSGRAQNRRVELVINEEAPQMRAEAPDQVLPEG